MQNPSLSMAATGKETDEEKAARLEAERQAAEDGAKMEVILNEPLIKKAFADLGKDYYAEFLAADTPQKRREAWAQSKALYNLAKELRSVLDRGTMAKHARQVRQSQIEATERRQKRRGS
jgi:hypothetical protein